MRRPAAFFAIALALWAISLAPWIGARAQDNPEEGPIQIEKCQTISKPGSYKLVRNLTTTGDCLVITASFVTIDLAGFTISGPGGDNFARGILADTLGITGTTVRNGSISGFGAGVALSDGNSIVEGLRVFFSAPPHSHLVLGYPRAGS
jgi:hypothetical protein